LVYVLIACLGLAKSATGTQPASTELIFEPARGEIGLFHGGVDLVVSAELESGVDVALVVTGPPADLHMRKKERVWGLFWAPTKDVTFEKVPSLYILRTSEELDELAPKLILNELGLGYEALRSSVEVDGEEDLFPELIRLKESEGLFSLDDIDNHPGRTTERTSVRAELPANAPATIYSVQLFAFRGGKLVTRGERDFELTQTKLMAFITSLAREHSLLYGVLAVVVALGAGLGVGFLYGSAKKH
jgi:uncharacterized protein (TIGR02186 family)